MCNVNVLYNRKIINKIFYNKLCSPNIYTLTQYYDIFSSNKVNKAINGNSMCVFVPIFIIGIIYVDIMAWGNCRQFWLLIRFSFIGQFFHPIGGDGMK